MSLIKVCAGLSSATEFLGRKGCLECFRKSMKNHEIDKSYVENSMTRDAQSVVQKRGRGRKD